MAALGELWDSTITTGWRLGLWVVGCMHAWSYLLLPPSLSLSLSLFSHCAVHVSLVTSSLSLSLPVQPRLHVSLVTSSLSLSLCSQGYMFLLLLPPSLSPCAAKATCFSCYFLPLSLPVQPRLHVSLVTSSLSLSLCSQGYMYWSDINYGTLNRAHLNGSDAEILHYTTDFLIGKNMGSTL